jgi:uncharacterized protein YkwD
MNFVDLVFVIIFGWYIWRGYAAGLWLQLPRFIAFFIAIITAFFTYQILGKYIALKVNAPPQFIYVGSFVAVFFGLELIIYALLAILVNRIPEHWRHSLISKILGIIPAFLNGCILVMMLVLVVMVLPLDPSIKTKVSTSSIGDAMTKILLYGNDQYERVSGKTFAETFSYLTVHPESHETVSIPYKPKTLSIDATAEERMLELVNEERRKVGAKPLVMDALLTEVAREHSRDMWNRQYFSHYNPDGEDPFDRMKRHKVQYLTAGENLALAPTVSVAHQGLMNSPGHKRNILDPNFGRIGIGVISGGFYGKMFTQAFTD